MSELLEFILGTILEYLISWMETCEYQRFYALFAALNRRCCIDISSPDF